MNSFPICRRGDAGLRSMGAFEDPTPPLAWGPQPAPGEEGGRFPRAALASPRACAGPGCQHRQGFCLPGGAAAGHGARDGHRAPLCAAVPRGEQGQR